MTNCTSHVVNGTNVTTCVSNNATVNWPHGFYDTASSSLLSISFVAGFGICFLLFAVLCITLERQGSWDSWQFEMNEKQRKEFIDKYLIIRPWRSDGSECSGEDCPSSHETKEKEGEGEEGTSDVERGTPSIPDPSNIESALAASGSSSPCSVEDGAAATDDEEDDDDDDDDDENPRTVCMICLARFREGEFVCESNNSLCKHQVRILARSYVPGKTNRVQVLLT